MIQFNTRSRDEAKALGYAVYNGGNHVCIDLDNAPATISVRTPDGKLVTFAFTCRPDGEGHQCVDIKNHSMALNDSGNALQRASFLGQGPTNATCHESDDSPTTVVVLSLPQ